MYITNLVYIVTTKKCESSYLSEVITYNLDNRYSVTDKGRYLILSTTSRPALDSTHSPLHWVLGVKLP